MNNKIYSLAVFTTFGVKATGKLTIDVTATYEDKSYKLNEIDVAGQKFCLKDLLVSIQKEIQKTIALFFCDDCFYEYKVNDKEQDLYKQSLKKDDKINIVFKKKLKVKEIKIKDSNFIQCLKGDLTSKIAGIIKENRDFTYKTIFDAIKSISNLFKSGEFGIKLNNLEDTNENHYKGTDKLKEGDEITVILDEKKIDEKAFSKFVFEYDEDIYKTEDLRRNLDKSIEKNDTITKVFLDYLFKEKVKGSKEKVEFDVFKNEDNTPIKCNSKAKIPDDLKYFKVKLTKDIVKNHLIKKDSKVILSKKGCKIYNDNILKSIEETINRSSNGNLLECFKESIFIDENIDKTMISIKNQDPSDTKIYSTDYTELPRRKIIDLSPEAFSDQVQIVVEFSIADVEKDGKKLKNEFKNKFTVINLHYGENKSVLINMISSIIPGIKEGDIKLNGQSLPNEIKEGGEISISFDKIPDENFENKLKEEKHKGEVQKDDNKKGNCEGTGNGNGDNSTKNDGYCGSNKKN